MDGKTLSRIGAVAFAAVAITISAIQVRQQPTSASPASAVETVASSDHLQAELLRCQSIGQAGASDTACLHVWAENRRRFLASDNGPTDDVMVETGAAAAPAGALAPANQGDGATTSLDVGAR